MATKDELVVFFMDYVNILACGDPDGPIELKEPVGLFPSPNGNFAMDRQTFRSHRAALMDFIVSRRAEAHPVLTGQVHSRKGICIRL